jgi:hypothetical protein
LTVLEPTAIVKRVFIAVPREYARVGSPFHPIEKRIWPILSGRAGTFVDSEKSYGFPGGVNYTGYPKL